MSSNLVGRAINTDISWCKEAHRLRWAFLYACKSPLKHWPLALFLQEYTGGRAGGIVTFAGDRRMRLAGTQKYTISKGSRVIVY
jgi:hypothetical protein